MEKRTFTIQGMHCAACAAAVERAVRKLGPCENAYVNFAAGELSYTGGASDEEIIKAIAKAGFKGELRCIKTPLQAKNDPEQKYESAALRDLIVVWCAGVLLTLLTHLYTIPALVQFLLLLPVLYGGRKFFTGGIPALFRLAPDMNSLIASGVISGVAYSLVTAFIFKGGVLFFHASAMIIMLVMLGKFLEARSRRKAAETVRALAAFAPEKALRINKDGSEETVSASDAAPGMKFKILPGAKVPADGVVVSGHSSCDESMFTGESLPVAKHPGQSVVGGSINLEGVLVMECTANNDHSMLSKIIEAVRAAQGTQVPIARIADKVAGVFVWCVLGIALATFVLHLCLGSTIAPALSHALGVLVIACPCSLGLATPVALICGVGKGAKSGILIKSGAVMESTAKVKTVVFDKTGTLTTGVFTVASIETLHEKWNDSKILTVAAALEKSSSHPLGAAVLEKAKQEYIEVPVLDDVQTIPGIGVKGVFGGKCYEVCREEEGATPRLEGASSMLLKENGEKLGRILLRDSLREDAVSAVALLKKMGMRVEMITGDNESAASAVAKELALDGFTANVLPAEKSAMIENLRRRYGAVAMVGDGINDAPALAAADTGIAIGSGTGIAIETADAVLISNDLKNVPALFGLSRRTMRIIRQNLFWAFAYNIIGIPLAAGVFETFLPFAHVTPVFCAAAMGASSVTVVLNALRLMR